MKSDNSETKIIEPKFQMNLYGYKNYFDTFVEQYENCKLPNIVLLSGYKGLGKATFAYHFINYLLSQDEINKYSLKDFTIQPNNLAFRLIQNNTHPNFFLLDNTLSDENIMINQVRYLIKFLHKSAYSKNIKIVLLDNIEYMNNHSSNALLKSLEEPPNNTYFFIINNISSKILRTVKSRCVEYKFHFNALEKKNIFKKIARLYQLNYDASNLDKFFFFDTPGNLLRYLLVFNDSNLDVSKNDLSCILYLINRYKNKKDLELLNFISLFIENFYNELSLRDNTSLNNYCVDKYKILHLISEMKKYNLDKKNLLISVDRILKNETR